MLPRDQVSLVLMEKKKCLYFRGFLQSELLRMTNSDLRTVYVPRWHPSLFMQVMAGLGHL